MSFNKFIRKYGLKKRATSNVKIKHTLSSLSLNDVGIFLSDGSLKTDIGIVNLHPTKGIPWVLYINQYYFDSNGCSPPQKLSKFI